jgi:hypothetical protein
MERATRRLGSALALCRTIAVYALFAVGFLTVASPAAAQFGQLVSPGPLSKAHSKLEGAANCQKCHEPGRKVTATLCLSCHKPIAERIKARKGVHRDVTDECTGCHVEHQGVDGELRPFDPKTFNHTTETGFVLDGRHATLAKDCAKCHKTRSFLTNSQSCNSCHTDVHKGTLGADCRSCHSTSVPFKDAKSKFDHTKAAFPLTGAHAKVECAKCHINQRFKGLAFAQCTDCHKSPHRATFTACLTCHTNDTWKTQKVEHVKTGFPLRGSHATVPCAKCHTRPATQVAPKFDRCASCHTDPHKGAFKQDCASCHTEAGFKKAKFDHASTRFSLTGKHAEQPCAACHKNLPKGGVTAAAGKSVDFRGLQPTCISCHQDVHKGEMGQACESCHTPASFKLSAFKHPRFPEFFGGSHQTVACSGCHVPQGPAPAGAPGALVPKTVARYKNTSTACASCHKDPHLGQVSTACEQCHSIDAAKFAPVKFLHSTAAFKLTGKHETVECRKCHKPETAAFPAGRGTAVRLKGLSQTCVSCHADQHLGQLGTACEKCHTPVTFKLASYAHAKQASFMVGRHAAQPCSACHKPVAAAYPGGRGLTVRYKTGEACESCHTDQHQGQMGRTCDTCHTPSSWRVVSRGFHKVGVFPLEGRHLAVECSACHIGGAIKGTPTRCFDCHWIRRQDDRYATRLGTDCGSCHRPVSWTAVNWNHGTFTGLQLSPVHRALGCDACHKNQTFRRGDVTCYSCHQEDYQRTKEPNHAAAGFPTDCLACHRASHTSWSQTTFSHNSYFPLVGSHATQQCAACHKNGVYKGTPRDCVGCHRTTYDRTSNPPHAAAGFPTTCESCHKATDRGWAGASFNHNSVFALVGPHATQACTACHKNGVYRGTPRDCVGCHRTTYDRTANPPHAAAGFSTACETCHSATASGWSTSFDHNKVFALQGRHAAQACAACHKNGVYRGTPRDCVGCHRTNYDRTTNPNHAAAGYPTACEACHRASDSTWRATFNHASVFPLSGKHTSTPCASCHVNNVYQGTPRACVGCHKANYDRTTNPNHAAAGIPTTCESCHTPASWAATFNHNAVFALVGRHATASCASCHVNNVYKGTPRDCYGCHRATYDRTTSPNHPAAGFPTTCESCHSASASTWTASFDHSRFYPLLGRHLTAACSRCHVNNVYRGTSRDCYPCHQARYDATTSPNHRGAGFPTACEACHRSSDTSWNQGTFNHTWFPITSGRHAGRLCADCHQNSANYKVFQCTTACHPQSSMDREHSGRQGYRYDSAACYSCHPTGRG